MQVQKRKKKNITNPNKTCRQVKQQRGLTSYVNHMPTKKFLDVKLQNLKLKSEREENMRAQSVGSVLAVRPGEQRGDQRAFQSQASFTTHTERAITALTSAHTHLLRLRWITHIMILITP